VSGVPGIRLAPALLGAVLVTLAVFLFMQSLIERGRREDVTLAVYEHVEILRNKPQEQREEKSDDAPEAVNKEPAMESVMESLQVAAPTPEPARMLEMPALDLAMGDLQVPSVGHSWKAPLGAGGIGIGGSGQDARGFIEVIPYNTRKPNVPEVAWHNKISGWVLVAFNVTTQGATKNIRVLDARPRGVFEEKVISAVEDWRYTLSVRGKFSGDVVLTQRVEVKWQDYPDNLPNVD
jgi:protein TonB